GRLGMVSRARELVQLNCWPLPISTSAPRNPRVVNQARVRPVQPASPIDPETAAGVIQRVAAPSRRLAARPHIRLRMTAYRSVQANAPRDAVSAWEVGLMAAGVEAPHRSTGRDDACRTTARPCALKW